MLATLGEEFPLASAVPLVVLDGWTDLLVHLSTLAAHTRNLLRNPRLALMLVEPDHPDKNPLALTRLVLEGSARPVDREDPKYAALARRFTDRFPEAAVTMSLMDFQLWRLAMRRAQLIAGFGQAYTALAEAPAAWRHQGRPAPRP